MAAGNPFGRPTARRFLVALVAVLLFGGWFAAFAVLLTARPRARFKTGADYPSVLFSPDSKLVATSAPRGPIQVRDTLGKLLLSVADEWEPIQSVQFSSDGSLLAAYQIGGDLKIWDCLQGEVRYSLKPQTKDGHAVRFGFAPYGQYLIVQDYDPLLPMDHVAFVDVATSHKQAMLEVDFDSLTFSRETNVVTAWERKVGKTKVRMRRWRYGQSDPLVRLVSELGIAADDVVTSPDGKLVAVMRLEKGQPGNSACIEIRDAGSLQTLRRLSVQGFRWLVRSFEFSSNGRLLAVYTVGPEEAEILIWDIGVDPPVQIGGFKNWPLYALKGTRIVEPTESGADLYSCMPLKRHATLAIAGDSTTLLIGGQPSLPTVSCSPDGRFVCIEGLTHHEEPSRLLTWISEHIGTAPVKEDWQVVRVWDADTGQPHVSFDDCVNVVFSPDSKTLAAIRSDGAIELWDVPIKTVFNSWWTITAAAIAATVASLIFLAAMKRLSRRTAKPAEASGPAERPARPAT